MDQNPLVLFVQLIRHNHSLLFDLLLQTLSSSTFCFIAGSVGLMMVIIGGHNQRYADILDRGHQWVLRYLFENQYCAVVTVQVDSSGQRTGGL